MAKILNPTGGNVFSAKSFTLEGGQRPWREIRHRYPSGGTLNADALDKFKAVSGGYVLPAGTPVSLSSYVATPYLAYSATSTYKAGEGVIQSNKLYVAKADIDTAEAFTAAHWTEVTKLSGFTQDDVVIDSDTTSATVTVVYAGELYAYMYAAADITALKNTAPAEIHFVE